LGKWVATVAYACPDALTHLQPRRPQQHLDRRDGRRGATAAAAAAACGACRLWGWWGRGRRRGGLLLLGGGGGGRGGRGLALGLLLGGGDGHCSAGCWLLLFLKREERLAMASVGRSSNLPVLVVVLGWGRGVDECVCDGRASDSAKRQPWVPYCMSTPSLPPRRNCNTHIKAPQTKLCVVRSTNNPTDFQRKRPTTTGGP
jgi:hypothetical protein